jgi:hypothetical protein
MDVESREEGRVLLTGSYEGARFELRGRERYLEEAQQYRYRFSGTSDSGEFRISFRTAVSTGGLVDRGNTSFRIDGKPIHLNIMKERSDAPVRVYEGSYSGSAAGNWNFLLRGRELSGYYAGEATGEFAGRYEAEEGLLFIWGTDANMLARGELEGEERAGGVWIFDPDGGYTEETPEEHYPSPAASDNRWEGSRSM